MSAPPFYAQRQNSTLDHLAASSVDFTGSIISMASTGQLVNAAGGLTIQTQQSADQITFITNSGVVDVSAQALLVETVPMTTNSAVSKAYVDAAIAGIAVKQSCAARLTTEVDGAYVAAGSKAGKTLTGNVNGALPLIDGYAALVDDRIVVDWALSVHNGIYVVSSLGGPSSKWVLTRAADFDGNAVVAKNGSTASVEVQGGSYTLVRFGTLNAGREYAIQTAGVISVDVTAFAWVQINNAATHTAGNSGIVISGNAISVSASLLAFSQSSIGISGSSIAVASPASTSISLDCQALIVSGNYAPSSSASALVPKSYVDTQISLAAPVGSVISYGGISAPSGWVACNGSSSLSRSSYSALFSILSYTTGQATISNGSATVTLTGSDAMALASFVGAAIDSGSASGVSGCTILSVSTANSTLTLSAPATLDTQLPLYVMPYGRASNVTFNPPDLRGEVVRGWAGSGALDAGRAFGSKQSGSMVAASLGDADVSGPAESATPWVVENDFVKNADSVSVYTGVAMYSPALAYYPDAPNPKATLSRAYNGVRMSNVAMLYIMKAT